MPKEKRRPIGAVFTYSILYASGSVRLMAPGIHQSSKIHRWIIDFVELIWYNITDDIFIDHIVFLIVYLVRFSI